jgi:hypothetical protein
MRSGGARAVANEMRNEEMKKRRKEEKKKRRKEEKKKVEYITRHIPWDNKRKANQKHDRGK